MPTLGIPNLHSDAAAFLNPLHKKLPNGSLSCSLNSNVVLEFIDDPLVKPRSLRSTGDFNECEHTREPDHMLVHSPWHAYIPVADSMPASDRKAWIFEDSVPPDELFTPTHGRKGLVSSAFLQNVKTTVEDTLSWLNVVFAAYGNPSIDLNLSHVDSLRCFQGTYSEISTEVWKLRRLVLIAWGYIIYSLLNAAEDWKQHALCTPQFIQNVTSSGLLGLPCRGLIIQAQNPPPFADIVIYLHHQVPIHYYWTTGCVHWLDPAALLSMDIHAAPSPRPADRLTLSIVVEGPPTQYSFWRAGEFPISNGEIHKQRVFVTSDSNVTRTEITGQADLIHELQAHYVSRLFPEPTGDIVLIREESIKVTPAGNTSRETDLGVSNFTPPAGTPQSLSIPTLVHLFNLLQAVDNPKTQWIYQQFDKPYIYFSSDYCVPKIPLPEAVEFVTHGKLVVSKRTEARLVLWRAQYPQVPVWFFAHRCLSLGMDWRVFTASSTPTLQPSISTSTSPRPLKAGTSFFVDYARRVHSLLQLPHARRFLTMGGLLWRIALHYGPSELFASAISGPSSDASKLFRCEAHDTLVDDTVSDEDINLLLGITDRGSIWPTLDLWEKNENWAGEWGARSERWFTARIREIERSSLSAILTRQQWKSAIRRHTVTAFKSDRTFGTEAHAAWVCSELETLFPPSEPLTL
ncbi:hypothetical protein CY34DRAFT_16598 [Suillus luteus UH-Slu-Lm8-n1]|uniref:Uncharacterized protein n=1 Tax=Suillus luteus UH-Slu-Lm8-n1 TaxID=930992 RepID=A0A0C9ZF84_9AGAM|nr:hypothetical protein CY34DRAFT_16598 [Suillus luteus UH-Slu-Lm8-n1]